MANQALKLTVGYCSSEEVRLNVRGATRSLVLRWVRNETARSKWIKIACNGMLSKMEKGLHTKTCVKTK